jgi:hypothetical protein
MSWKRLSTVSSGASSDVGDAGVVVHEGKKRGRIFLGCVGTLGDGCAEVEPGSGEGGVKSGNGDGESRRTEAGLVKLGAAVPTEADLAVDKALQPFSAATCDELPPYWAGARCRGPRTFLLADARFVNAKPSMLILSDKGMSFVYSPPFLCTLCIED